MNYKTPTDYVLFFLRLKVKEGGRCTFSYSVDGKKYNQVGEEFQARKANG